MLEGGVGNAATAADRNNKQAIFNNFTHFTDCITETNDTQVDNAKNLDVVMLMYYLIKCSDNYSKTSGSLWQYCRAEPNSPIIESESFKFKSKFLYNTNNEGIMNEKTTVPLKYLSNFWKNLEMPLINFEINLILTMVCKLRNF